MKTAVEQLMIDSFGEDFRMTVNDYQLNAFQKALEKEKEQIKILTDALQRIKDWDDEMHSEWDDQGEFASFTLKTYNQNK